MTVGFFHRVVPSRLIPASLLLGGLLLRAGAGACAEPPAPNLEAGKRVYEQSCARCHGPSGKGDGVDAKRFYPRPRDLTMGVYKFRSTASGTPPSDADLFRTITNGLPGTNMPDWRHLDEAARWQVVYYLKSLSPVFQQPAPPARPSQEPGRAAIASGGPGTQPAPVALPADPGAGRADLKKGRAVFERLGCAACHGASGRANGTSASGLVDDWGMPIRPANLTQGWTYRGGSDAQAVAMRIMAGIDGAGMPSYAEAMAPDELWPLAHYLVSLQEPAHWNMIMHPLRVDGALPAALDDPRWANAERTDVRLRNVVTADGEWQHPPTVRSVAIQAIANEGSIAFRFSWDDPTQDPPAMQAGVAGTAIPSDMFALVLKPSGSQGDVVTLQAWPYAGAPVLDLSQWSAEAGAAGERVATDYEPAMVTAPLTSVAAYHDGRWQLLLQRPFRPANPDGASAMDPEGFVSLAAVVWDGGNPEARAVSPWVDLALRAPGRAKQTAEH